jgi:hypothetical protein
MFSRKIHLRKGRSKVVICFVVKRIEKAVVLPKGIVSIEQLSKRLRSVVFGFIRQAVVDLGIASKAGYLFDLIIPLNHDDDDVDDMLKASRSGCNNIKYSVKSRNRELTNNII